MLSFLFEVIWSCSTFTGALLVESLGSVVKSFWTVFGDFPVHKAEITENNANADMSHYSRSITFIFHKYLIFQLEMV